MTFHALALTFSVFTAQTNTVPEEALHAPPEAIVEYHPSWHVNGIVASTILGLQSGLAADLALQSHTPAVNWTVPLVLTAVSAVGGHFLGDFAAKGSTSAKVSIIAEYCIAATMIVGAVLLGVAAASSFNSSWGNFHWE
jgi:hypothetical protein